MVTHPHHICMHKITNGIKILSNPVSETGVMIPGSFHCFQLHLATLVVSEQRYIITYETNR